MPLINKILFSEVNPYYNEARLPRQEIEYDWLDINTADVRLGTRYRKRDEADADTGKTVKPKRRRKKPYRPHPAVYLRKKFKLDKLDHHEIAL